MQNKIKNLDEKSVLIKVLYGHKYKVNSVAISRDGKYALSGSDDETVRYWNLRLEEFLNIK